MNAGTCTGTSIIFLVYEVVIIVIYGMFYWYLFNIANQWHVKSGLKPTSEGIRLHEITDWLIISLGSFFGMKALAALEIQDTILYSYNWFLEIFLVHVPIDCSTHYPAFYTVRLHCRTLTLMPACQTGKQFGQRMGICLYWYLLIPFYDGLWYDPAGSWTHDLLHKRLTC